MKPLQTGPRRRLLFGAITVAMVLTVGVVIAEAVFRIENARAVAAVEERIRKKFNARRSADPVLIYEGIPGRAGANSAGFRDVEHAVDKSPGTFRIVLVGDSVAASHGVSTQEESIARRLEHHLHERLRGNFEVVVMAMKGYSTSQEIVLLRERGLLYRPDLIVWGYCLNDPASPIYHDANGELGHLFYRPRSHAWHRLSRAVVHLNERVRGNRDSREYHRFLHEFYWHRVTADFGELRTLVEAHDVPLLFAVFPIFETNAPPETAFRAADYALRDVHARLIGLAEECGFVTVDLALALDGEPLAEIMLNPGNPWHPNAHAFDLLAQYIALSIGSQRSLGLATR